MPKKCTGLTGPRAALAGLCFACSASEPAPLRVGVFAGDPFARAIEFGFARAEACCGIAIERVVAPAEADPVAAAEGFAADPQIAAVVGLSSSSAVLAAGPSFIAAEKVLITPAATSAEIFRQLRGQPHVFRTVESALAEVVLLLEDAKARELASAALLSDVGPLGETYFDAFGFFAAERGVPVTRVVRRGVSQSCDQALREATLSSPALLVVASEDLEFARCLLALPRPETLEIVFGTGIDPAALRESPGATGTRGLALSAEAGFEDEYLKTTNTPLPPFGAAAHDAAFWIALASQAGGVSLSERLVRLGDADGAAVDYRAAAPGFGSGPGYLAGASGPLWFDQRDHVDRTTGLYRFWQLEGGQVRTVSEVRSGFSEDDGRASKVTTPPDPALRTALDSTTSSAAALRTGLRVFIAALSGGYDNYRHQADALLHYQRLRSAGVPDDRIFLVLDDDLASDPRNPEPGVVRAIAGGPDLRRGAVIDEATRGLDADGLLGLLEGRPARPGGASLVLEPGDDLFVFLVGHGGRQGLYVDQPTAADSLSELARVITPDRFAATFRALAAEGRYRQALLAVEACHAGILGASLDSRDTLLFTAGSATENSLAANYDPAAQLWRADQFAFALDAAFSNTTLEALYEDVYSSVSGSHPSVYNEARYAGVGAVSPRAFAAP